MLKKTILLANFLFLSIVMIAQTDAQIKKISNLACDCTNEELKYRTKQILEEQLVQCIVKAANEEKIHIAKSDTQAIISLKARLEPIMSWKCPYIFSMIVMIGDKRLGGDVEAESKSIEGRGPDIGEYTEVSSPIFPTVTGRVINIVETEFITLTVVDDAKKEHKLIWFECFDNDDEYMKDINKFKQGKHKFILRDAERFLPKSKNAMPVKIIIKADKL